MSEPVKLREGEAKEDAKLTDFQQELVQMAATLCGDHKKDTYPHKLVDNMTVIDGVNYVKNAFTKFLNESEKARTRGVNETNIFVPQEDDNDVQAMPKKSKSFASKFFSCIACGTNS